MFAHTSSRCFVVVRPDDHHDQVHTRISGRHVAGDDEERERASVPSRINARRSAVIDKEEEK